MATSAQVQQLYIALLGRAADKPGLDWWLENINGTEGVPGERTLEEAAAAFTTSEEFVSTYGSLQGAELVTAVYTNLFERTPSQEEVTYWVNDGRPADQLLAAFLAYASPADQTVINNKVTVAQYYTEAAGADYDLDDAAAIIADVDGTAKSVSDALLTLPVTDATLSAAVGTWEAANEAKDTFLAGLDLDNNSATPTTANDVKALIGTTAGPVVDFNANTYSTTDLTATSTAAQQEAAFATARAQYEVAVVAQQAKVTDAQNAVNALADSVDVNAYVAAKAKAAATEAALNPAKATAVGAIALYEALSTTKALTDVLLTDYSVNTTTGAVTVTASTGLAALASVKDGALVLNSGVTETTNPGVTALLAAINGDIAAQVADVKADLAVTAAAAKVGAGAGDVTKVDTLITEKNKLTELQKTSEVLEKAIADVKDAYSLNAELTKLEANIETAFGKIAGADLLDGSDAGKDAPSAGADLFVFNGGNRVIDTGFAADDRIFVGSDYTLVDLADLTGKAIGTDAVGSASALEVFWDAANSTLYVEKEAFSGNAVGLGNFETITLTGVTADLEINGGFVQLA